MTRSKCSYELRSSNKNINQKVFTKEPSLKYAGWRMSVVKPMLLSFSSSASTKNPVQKRTREKFPIDVVTSSQLVMDQKEPLPGMKMDVPAPQPAHTEAHLPPSAETENFTPGLCFKGSDSLLLGSRTST